MASNLNNLFIWNNSFNKKEKRHNQDCNEYWKKRTEIATDEAVRCATGIAPDKRSTFLDDDVYKEAQQVVRGWLTEQKVYGKDSDRDSFLRLSCEEMEELRQPSAIEVHKEWEHLINKLDTNQGYKDEIDKLLEPDEGDATKDQRLRTVLNNLHKKSFVNKSQLRLVDSPRQVDVVKRMESRQEQVKRKREEFLKNEELRKMEKLAEKEARSDAMKMLKEEKLKKEINKKKEEELIQIEMHRIRAEIQMKRQDESKERERVRDTHRLSARVQLQEAKEVQTRTNVDTKQRFQIISEIVERKFLNNNKTILRRCFQLWRDETAKRNISLTQATAWNDWQILRRVFRGWQRHSRLTVINKKIEIDQQRMRSNQRKEAIALSFWKKSILKKCLIHWSLYVVDEKETRWFVKLEEMRKRKMITYIENLQEKAKENQNKLNLLTFEKNEHDIGQTTEIEISPSCQISIKTERASSAHDKVLKNNRSCSSSRSASKSTKAPSEAWQVTKKHVDLPLKQLIDDPNSLVQKSINFKSLRPPKTLDTYASRNATQKELIENQRSKLKEQELLINELVSGNVLHKVKEEMSRFKAPSDSNTQAVSPDRIEHCIDEEIPLVTTELIPKKVNKIVAQMEERAKERERIKSERLEKQKQHDEEKRKILAEQIAEQCRLEAEDKHKREQILRAKRDKEKIHEAAKKKQMQIEQEKNSKADRFYESMLLRRYGIGQWKRLLEMKRNNGILALDHCRKTLLRKVFSAWLNDVNEIKNQQTKIITLFYNRVLLTRCFYRFQLYKERFQFMEQLADRHYLGVLTKKVFLLWRLSNHRSQIRLDKLQVQSERLYEKNLLKGCFSVWKLLPVAARVERVREKRKEIMRQKVASIIPDFKPIYSDK